MQWAASYIGSNWQLMLLFVIAIGALGLFAWLARSWKAVIAALALIGVGFAIQHIDKTAFERAVAEQKARELAVLQDRIATLNKVAEQDAERAKQDAAEIDRLKLLAGNTPKNDTPCLPPDAAERIGAIK